MLPLLLLPPCEPCGQRSTPSLRHAFLSVDGAMPSSAAACFIEMRPISLSFSVVSSNAPLLLPEKSRFLRGTSFSDVRGTLPDAVAASPAGEGDSSDGEAPLLGVSNGTSASWNAPKSNASGTELPRSWLCPGGDSGIAGSWYGSVAVAAVGSQHDLAGSIAGSAENTCALWCALGKSAGAVVNSSKGKKIATRWEISPLFPSSG
mmetsp:Transcript_10067/g.20589  ORF Transcript_10067/g.20589 Transcript_10067/m.20589 type:complete len:205 (-) Transcript_10067:695-1309(-)